MLRPSGPPPAASVRPPAAAPATAAAEASEAARGSPPLLTTAASEGDPRLYPHLRLTLRRTHRRSMCCNRLHRRHPRPRVGSLPLLRRPADEAARKSPLLPTTAASWGDPRLFPHLRLTTHRTRRRLTCEGREGCSEAARSVGSMAAERWGGRGCTQIDAATHHGRLQGRSRGLRISPVSRASNEPWMHLLQSTDWPPAATDRRPPQRMRHRK